MTDIPQIPCTGQRPNSSIIASYLPDVISKETSRILVKPTLQVLAPDDGDGSTARIFALGDVAEHGGPKMARAGFFQSRIVASNICDMIGNRPPSRPYVPKSIIEGAIKLTIGKTHWVMYAMDDDGRELLVPGQDGHLDVDIQRGWKQLGAVFEPEKAPGYIVDGGTKAD